MLSTMTAWFVVSSDGSLSAPALFMSWSWAETGWLNPFWAWAWLNQYSPPDSPPLSLMWLGAWHNSSNSSVWSVWKFLKKLVKSHHVYRAVVPEYAGCAMAHPDFGRSVNLISTRGDKLCPPNYYWHTRIFSPIYTSILHGWVYCHLIIQL